MFILAKRMSVLILSFLMLIPRALFAAQVTVLPQQTAVIQTAEFQTNITVDTGGESINTFAGTITYPENIIALKEIHSGNSIVNYWVEAPKNANNKITFSGITPGGYVGNHGFLFSLVFTAVKQGNGSIAISNPLFLKNDGLGTSARIAISNSSISVLPPDQRRNIVIPPLQDATPPEPFRPEISKTPVLFNDSWTLFFGAEDKGSGIDHYEVQEYSPGIFSFFSPWIRTTSPYLIRDQSLEKAAAVRAVDKAGNIRTAHVLPRNAPAWYANLTNWFLLASGLAILAVLKTFLWRKR
ncbi:MAG: hypothetical protein WC802_03395 [Patescibacteria group bacterium]|jgi:hypothetical protein